MEHREALDVTLMALIMIAHSLAVLAVTVGETISMPTVK